MSLLFRALTDYSQFEGRTAGWSNRTGRSISRRSALAHSAFWACTRLRADLISTLPIDVYRKIGKIQVDVPTPPVLVAPSGDRIDMTEFMYSSQTDLDTCGNTFGVIVERDGLKLPRRIDLVPRDEVVVQVRKGEISYRIAGEIWEGEKAKDVWHERQYTTSGIAVGLSPVLHAAMTLYQHESAQEFASAWFAGGAIPTGTLRNENRKLDPKDTDATKARFNLAVENRDVFVTGKDWDYKVIEAQGSQASFIETMRVTDIDICRFLGVPGDMIDARVDGSSVTYANITQRNLQLLITAIGPAVIRREKALSRVTSTPRFVKLNTDALLRMDPETVAKMLGQMVKDRLITATEARELLNREPFTPAQIGEFDELFPARKQPLQIGA
jgi:HK97 family phage portal protein